MVCGDPLFKPLAGFFRLNIRWNGGTMGDGVESNERRSFSALTRRRPQGTIFDRIHGSSTAGTIRIF